MTKLPVKLLVFVVIILAIAASCSKNTPGSAEPPVIGADNSLFSFEAGTDMGFNTFLGGVTNTANSTDRAYLGSHSLRLDGTFDSAAGGAAGTNTTSIASVSGRQLKARIWVPSDFPAGGAAIYIQSANTWCWEQGTWKNFTAGAWNELIFDPLTSVPQSCTGDHNDVKSIGITFMPGSNFTGSIYLDSIEVIIIGSPTITMTRTQTPAYTATITPTVTITATFTATATATRGSILIDDFTDGDLNNSVTPAYANPWVQYWDNGPSLPGVPGISGSAGYGYCVAITGTTYTDGLSAWDAEVGIQTTLQTTFDTYLDLRGYQKFSARIKWEVAAPPLYSVMTYKIRIFNSNPAYSITYEFTPTGEWQDLDIPFTDFANECACPLDVVLSDVKYLIFLVHATSTVQGDYGGFAIHLDNVSFGMLP